MKIGQMPSVVWLSVLTHLQDIQLHCIVDAMCVFGCKNSLCRVFAPFGHLPIAVEIAILVKFVTRNKQHASNN
jgi:hypothetical protein